MKGEKTDNKSLVMYTSLIFLAAIAMIIVSFFAEKHLETQYTSEIEAQNVNLSNKAAMVSEENMQLVEMNRSLKDNNKDLLEQNAQLILERDALLKEKSGFEALVAVYDQLLSGKEKAARELLEGIYTEDLTQAQKEIYDALVKKTN